MANSWLRLWHDMPNDPKWRTIARKSGQSIGDVIAVYLHVLVNASNASEQGVTQCDDCERGRTLNLSPDDIASSLDIETEQVEQILGAMQGKVLEGDHVTGWSKRQPIREDDSAARTKAWRERKRAEKLAQEQGANANKRSVTQRDAPDKDPDKDKELKDPPLNPPGEKSGKKGFDPFDVILPDWISPKLWREWVEYRRQLKKPIKTQQGVTGMLKKLEEFRGKGHEPEAVIREAMANEWQGLFEPKNSQVTHARNQSGSMAERSLQQGREQWLREQSDRHASMATVGEHGADLRQPLDCEEWQSSYAPVGAANRYDDR